MIIDTTLLPGMLADGRTYFSAPTVAQYALATTLTAAGWTLTRDQFDRPLWVATATCGGALGLVVK